MSDAVTQVLAGIGLTPEDLEPEVLAIVRQHVDDDQERPMTPEVRRLEEMQARIGQPTVARDEVDTIEDRDERAAERIRWRTADRLEAAIASARERRQTGDRDADNDPRALAARVPRW